MLARHLALTASLLLLGCKSTPSSILLTIEAGTGLPAADELRLLVLGPAGIEVRDQRLPAVGAPALPGQVVLYPPRIVPLRLLCRALLAGNLVGEGLVKVEPRGGEQVSARLVIRPGRLPDGDGDGIPDEVDSCPGLSNPEQAPCPSDAGPEGGLGDGDGAGSELGRPDLSCDRDGDKHLSPSCGGGDCDDSNPAVHLGAAEGPPGAPSCSDTIDNDCDGAIDGADTGCRPCTKNPDCSDGNSCTKDVCEGTVCQSSLLATGTACDDGKFCTEGDTCLAGLCSGQPRSCPAPACQLPGICNESLDRCDHDSQPDGSSCSDGNICTQGEACISGICTAPAPSLETVDVVDAAYTTDRALRLDAAGHAHLVYGTISGSPPGLRYASNSSGSWKAEVIDAADGTWPAIAFDAKGQLHVIYDREVGATRSMIHAIRDPGTGSWTSNSFASGQGHASLALDGAGALHAIYMGPAALRHAVWNGTSWSSGEDVASGVAPAQVGWHSSMVIDGGGKLHVAYGEGSAGSSVQRLHYASNSSGSWISLPPAPSLTTTHGGFASLARDSSGKLFITHTNNSAMGATSGTLYLTSGQPGGWTTETIGPGHFSSLAVTSQGQLVVAYRDPYANQARLKIRPPGPPGSAWTTSTIETIGPNTAGWLSVAREPSGRLHVSYEHNVGPSELRHALISGCP